ncbi:MAG: nitroreductase family protein [Oscillospiraceae bacterium]
MTILEAMESRHAVRSYLDKPIPADVLAALRTEVEACNAESGLHIQLVTDEPQAFDGFMAHYGKFSGVKNYFALVGKKGAGLDEALGYYGERLVLQAQMLGLNTCWVAMSFSKSKCGAVIDAGEKLVIVIPVGYGTTQGAAHKSKPMEQLCSVSGAMPDWFRAGMEAAMLAPTAMNQQKFLFTLQDGAVQAKATGGFYSKVDLGIVKYHFEQAAGKETFRWA